MGNSGITSNGLEYSLGNTKVPFVIVNFTSATACPAKRLGLCQCPVACYAKQQEEMWPTVLPFRTRQATWWETATSHQVNLAADEMEQQRQNRQTVAKDKVLRFSEAGDFVSQKQINLFAQFAQRLMSYGWTIYGYTARTDLNLFPLINIGVKINLSNDSKTYAKVTNRFKAVKQASGNSFLCQGDCRTCKVCRIVTGKTIEIALHGKRKYKQELS